MGNILIVGSGGRLGAALARVWSKAGEAVTGWDRKALPLEDLDGLEQRLEEASFDVLVNCAALTQVDYCESHREEAYRVNAEAPARIASVCARKAVRCIHIGTDYVFDGVGERPYVEEDPARPLSVYGASKLAGDEAVVRASEHHWVVRVSWVFGPDRPSFVDQIITRAAQEERVEAVADKWATPTYTLDAAVWLRPFLREVSGGGLLHLSNAGACTWQEYGQWALDCAAEAGLELKARRVGPLAMGDLKAFVAKRPRYTVMDTTKLARLGGMAPRSWKEAVREYVAAQVGAGVWRVPGH
jgi:dTDP-4-dehydrorhamnose reductase